MLLVNFDILSHQVNFVKIYFNLPYQRTSFLVSSVHYITIEWLVHLPIIFCLFRYLADWPFWNLLMGSARRGVGYAVGNGVANVQERLETQKQARWIASASCHLERYQTQLSFNTHRLGHLVPRRFLRSFLPDYIYASSLQLSIAADLIFSSILWFCAFEINLFQDTVGNYIQIFFLRYR